MCIRDRGKTTGESTASGGIDDSRADSVDASNDFHRAASSPGELARAATILAAVAEADPTAAEEATVECYYAPYLARQRRDVETMRKEEAMELPMDLDYDAVGGLSAEDREKLKEFRPATLAAAQRISGVTPSAAIALFRFVAAQKLKGNDKRFSGRRGAVTNGETGAGRDPLMESAL